MQCKWCASNCVKAGKQKSGKQKYRCKSCTKYQQQTYRYLAYDPYIHRQFSRFNKMGCGVKKMAGFLEISINTLQKWIGKAIDLEPVVVFPRYGIYDIDEIQTCVGKRKTRIWVTYGWHVDLRKPIGLNVGGRCSTDLQVVVNEILKCHPRRINTDNYAAYPGLIDTKIHRKGKRKANHIEREHKNLRKDIACLIRETMCFAKKPEMLEARIRWYLWGDTNPCFFL